MPADYNIPMTDAQITEALQLMVERVSEGWAQETYDGSPVGSGSPYYHKSSKWWATQAADAAAQAADAAARAEAAVPAGTAGAVFFDRAQTLTTAQQEQARQNIKAGGSNPNLLDNGFFTIRQRGEATFTGAGYTVDRWRKHTGTGTITPSADGIAVTGTSQATCDIRQDIPDAQFRRCLGQKVTGSVKINGQVYSYTATLPNTVPTQQQTIANTNLTPNVSFFLYWQSTNVILFRLIVDTNLTIEAAKLELGSVSTLANDAPPTYAEELAKCQFNGILKLNEGYCLTGRAINAAAAVFFVPWKHRAGGSGTSYVSGLISTIYHSGGSITPSTTPAKNSANTDFIRLTVTGLSGLTAGEPVIGEIGTNGLIVSNDL